MHLITNSGLKASLYDPPGFCPDNESYFKVWGAHATRVLVITTRDHELCYPAFRPKSAANSRNGCETPAGLSIPGRCFAAFTAKSGILSGCVTGHA
jgi:hypothetical protein